MGPDHAVVVDISSDEEDLGLDASDVLSFNSFEVLDRSDVRRQEESDDVVIVDEFSASAAKRRKKDSGLLAPDKGSGFDDDDCVVLDSDPDKPVSVVDDNGGEIGDRGDDLLIVAEKGQFACRDYPHPRHLCAHFPFSSSPHEKFCDLCHCYVCDSPAPCSCWDIGDKSTDHCHSTDKEERWQYLRQYFKQIKLESMFPQKPTDNPTSKIPPFQDPVPLSYSNLNPLLVPGSRSNSLQTCSAASISNSNAINQRNYYQPTILSCSFQRLGQRPTKSYPLNPSIQYIQRDSRVAGALTTQLTNSHTRFKRARTMQYSFTSLNNPPHNTIASSNHTPRGVLQKSTYATRTSQRPRSPQVGQQRSEDPLVTSPGASAYQMQANISSHFTLPTKQSSMCPPVTAADDSQESWQNLLASVASELGVSMFSDTGTSNAQQPPMFPSSSLPFDESYSKTDASQDTWSSSSKH
ncbi:RPM1 interacting protein 13-like [Musa acuminata AAA Group]|uniref:RPM1 interacting protein 13-like n=1 Tax=Musa acuminata AAA Group TaxID=214697 RepID=UPI0031D6404E